MPEMYDSRLKKLGALLFCLAVAASVGVAVTMMTKTAYAQSNLFNEIMDHKTQIEWKPAVAPQPLLPPEICNLLGPCNEDKGTAKVFILPVATVDGRKVGRAIFLAPTSDAKHPQVLVLKRETRTEGYFFLLGPDGTLSKAVYVEVGKPFSLVATELAQPTFNKDLPDWRAWAAKMPPAHH